VISWEHPSYFLFFLSILRHGSYALLHDQVWPYIYLSAALPAFSVHQHFCFAFHSHECGAKSFLHLLQACSSVNPYVSVRCLNNEVLPRYLESVSFSRDQQQKRFSSILLYGTHVAPPAASYWSSLLAQNALRGYVIIYTFYYSRSLSIFTVSSGLTSPLHSKAMELPFSRKMRWGVYLMFNVSLFCNSLILFTFTIHCFLRSLPRILNRKNQKIKFVYFFTR